MRRRPSGPASSQGPRTPARKSRPRGETPCPLSPGGPRRSRSARRRPCASRRRPACPASRRGGRRPPSPRASSRRTSCRPSRGRWSPAWRAPESRRGRRRPGRAPRAAPARGRGRGRESRRSVRAPAASARRGVGGRLGGRRRRSGVGGRGRGGGGRRHLLHGDDRLADPGDLDAVHARARGEVDRDRPLLAALQRDQEDARVGGRGEDGGSEAGGQESRGGQSDEELALVHVDQAPHSSPCRSGDASNDVSG